ncbi:ABC transporter ATP-binding protein [Erwinia rhapontici]|uniref:Spermidine/putrescine ABC transporter ATP-binding protein n=1 Tax=Erwinia rhapontici TaxID=55212 RepID=A0ABM7MVX6_ERWRD|nr:ABC transporter ATP-binding protein [Erwinia rhapontici]NKG30389.1 ABC transporter ATP-binding protein [Erwinia rhapontici]BCQ33359.1 spermidine/putrescine ABC transporter ATP-binding protein [Erwinia rhapontici]
MSAILINNLCKSFGSQPVLRDVSLHIEHGEFIAVLGPSGCGKTTLLRTLAGFETPDAGTISIGERCYSAPGQHLPPEQRDLSIVFQNYALWPHMSVAENVEYGLKVKGMARELRQQRVVAALLQVGLEGMAERKPADLSGGQRQRVALARCLVTRPQVVLLDEPLANLDVHLRATMEEEFTRFHQHSGATLLYITHDQHEAMALADRIVVMHAGQVMQFASPQTLYRQPACEMVARFIDDGRVVTVSDIEADGHGRAWVTLYGQRISLRASPQQPVLPVGKICLHAADLRLATEEQPGFWGTIQRVIYRGGYRQLEIAPEADPENRLTLMLTDAPLWQTGERLKLSVVDGWVIPA